MDIASSDMSEDPISPAISEQGFSDQHLMNMASSDMSEDPISPSTSEQGTMAVTGVAGGTVETALTAAIVHGDINVKPSKRSLKSSKASVNVAVGNNTEDEGTTATKVTGMRDGHADMVLAIGKLHGNVNVGIEDTLKKLQEVAQRRILEAEETFVLTKNFETAKRKLEEFDHLTILGASGEGKTTMSLMLAKEYKDRGYKVAFVEDIDYFDVQNIESDTKIVLIFDDIFGSVGLSTDVTQLRNKLSSIVFTLKHYKKEKTNFQNLHFAKKDQTEETQENLEPKSDIRMIFNTKTHNFRENILKLQHEGLLLFQDSSVIDLTTNKYSRYSDDERVAIFERYRILHGASVDLVTKKDIQNLSEKLFGFPMTCRLFFEIPSFTDKGTYFFQQPLHYLKLELQNLLSQSNENTAVFALMLLCENRLNLSHLELPGTDEVMDERIRYLSEFVTNFDRIGLCTTAKSFVGTFFSGDVVLQFAHSSIYDACACAMYDVNQSFVLSYCSDDFLYERLRAETSRSQADEHSNFIFVTKGFYDLFVSRLSNAVKNGQFSKSVTHCMLGNDQIANLLLRKLKFDLASKVHVQWIHQKDKEKGILYWLLHGHSALLVDELENIMKVSFTQEEIREAVEAATERDNMVRLKQFLTRLETNTIPGLKDEMLLLAAANGSSRTAVYLLEEGADLTTRDMYLRNSLHLACEYGNGSFLKALISQQEILMEPVSDAVSNAVDIDGHTPIMLAALSGSEECFELLSGLSDMNARDYNENALIHLASIGGNMVILQQVMASSNVNTRGNLGRTPIMFAAVQGHEHAFNALVRNNADVTLVSDPDNTVLHLACKGGNLEIVKQLVDTSNINNKGNLSGTPVMVAAVNGHKRVFDFLVSNNADLTLVDDNDDSLLHLACQGGNMEIVKQVVSPSNINSRGRQGKTSLMYAAEGGYLNMYDFLVEQHADHKLQAESNDNLLHMACRGGNTAIVESLVTISNINIRGAFGMSPIMMAAAKGHKNIFEKLQSEDADLTLLSGTRNTLLHLACQGGNKAIVQQLVPLFNINRRGRYGWTPIVNAAVNGHMHVYDFLVSLKADLTLLDDTRNSLFHLACLSGSMSVVTDLCCPTSINSRGMQGMTPVMMAAMNGHQSEFHFLVSKKADLTKISDTGDGLIHFACMGGNTTILRHIASPSNINSRGSFGMTPLMIAALKEHPNVFDFLVSHNANLRMVTKVGDNFLHVACQAGNVPVVKQLLSASNINSKGMHGLTPIMMAAANGREDVFDLLISSKADLTQVSDLGDNLLHLACQGGSIRIVQQLVTPSNINSRGLGSWTPVMRAAASGHHSVFEFLMSKDADLNLVDENDDDLLHLACRGGNTAIVQQLVSSSNINSRGSNQWTPVMVAAYFGHRNIVDLLIENQADLELKDVNHDDVVYLAKVHGHKHLAAYLKPLVKNHYQCVCQ